MRGYSSEFSVGVCRPVPQILTQFQTKICHFPHPFSDLASKSQYPFSDLCCTVIELRIANKSQELVKFSSNDIFWTLLFLYYSFGIKKTNTFIRSRGSLENHTRFKTMHNGQNLYPFSDQNGSKPIPFGAAHTYIAYIGE